MNREALCEQLYRNRKMDSAEQVGLFQEAYNALVDADDIETLRCFLKAFDDSTMQYDVMWNLVHGVEGFEVEMYLEELISATPQMFGEASEWLATLYERILNSEDYLSKYKALLGVGELTQKKAVINTLSDIAARDPNFLRVVKRVKEGLNSE